MQQMSIDQALQAALQHHQAGRLSDAEAIYRQILAAQPQHADAMHLLGYLAMQVQRLDVAEQLINQAIAAAPGIANFYNSLATVQQQAGRLEAALASVAGAIERDPDFAAAHLTLGNIHKAAGNLPAAIDAYRHATRLRADYAEAYNNLGTAYLRANDIPAAIDALQTAVRINPQLGDAFYNLAVALQIRREIPAAIAANREALKLRPDYVESMNNLGNLLAQHGDAREAVAILGRALELLPSSAGLHSNFASALLKVEEVDAAIAHLEEATRLDPGFADGFANLGNAYQKKGDLDRAVAAYERALALQPDHLVSSNNLGSTHKSRGEIDRALACYRRAVALRPGDAALHSNVLLTMHYQPGTTPQALLEEHRQWAQRHARPLEASIAPHPNDPSPDRTLRIGYLSADLKLTVIAHFLMPILAHRDRSAVQNICYADVKMPDVMTEKLRSAADDFRFVAGMNDQQIAELIRADQIDILVDLSLHSAHNRMMVFAHKPAPVQVTYLAYCSTSGMEQIDYRITDPWMDPPGSDLSVYTEQSVHLPETYWCYSKPIFEIAPGALPADASGVVTFGCLNNFCKVSADALAAWARILAEVPESRLLLHTSTGSHRDRVLEIFAAQQVPASRIEFIDYLTTVEYFRTYGRIDIALDSFPYNGGTTTCDALWMGVPVVSLAGQLAVARAGVSLLSNVGLPSLIAHSVDEYVQIATALACDRQRLRQLRGGLRARMEASPLMDAPRFTRHLENAYRWMWRQWCAKQPAARPAMAGEP
jgi:predicted O-linked N-acetylglucosamine transferase (SPINDLY family)